jgi:hypothetical protein
MKRDWDWTGTGATGDPRCQRVYHVMGHVMRSAGTEIVAAAPKLGAPSATACGSKERASRDLL